MASVPLHVMTSCVLPALLHVCPPYLLPLRVLLQCDLGDYDFSKQGDKEMWSQCCLDADMAHVKDKDCEEYKF
jgi:hypothetical protein